MVGSFGDVAVIVTASSKIIAVAVSINGSFGESAVSSRGSFGNVAATASSSIGSFGDVAATASSKFVGSDINGSFGVTAVSSIGSIGNVVASASSKFMGSAINDSFGDVTDSSTIVDSVINSLPPMCRGLGSFLFSITDCLSVTRAGSSVTGMLSHTTRRRNCKWFASVYPILNPVVYNNSIVGICRY